MSAAAAAFHPVVQEALSLLTEEGPEPANFPQKNVKLLQRALYTTPPQELVHAVTGMLTLVEAIRRQGAAIAALDLLEVIVGIAPVLHRLGEAARAAVDKIQKTAKAVFKAAPDEYKRRNQGLAKPARGVGMRAPRNTGPMNVPRTDEPSPFDE